MKRRWKSGWWRWLALPVGGLAWSLWLLATWASGGQNQQTITQQFALGAESTWLRVQNLGPNEANLTVDYYAPDGSRIAQEVVATLPAGAAASYHSSNANLPKGFNGSAIVVADAPIRTLLLKEITRNDRNSFDGDNAPARGYNRQYLPLAYAGYQGWNTRFAIQNASNSPACLRLTYRRGDGSVVLSEPAPGLSPASGCPKGGLSLPVGGSLLRSLTAQDPQLAQPFIGSVTIETVDGAVAASQQLVAAVADVWDANSSAFATYKGFGQDLAGGGELANAVFLPIIQKNLGSPGVWNTGYQVFSSDLSAPASVTATYCCDPRLPGPGGTLQKTIAVRSSLLVDQESEPELPDGFNGALTLVADRPIAAVAIRRGKDAAGEGYTTYTGVPLDAVGPVAWLPLVYRQFGASWQSWFQIQVVGGGNATVEVTYFGADLPGGAVSFTRPVAGVATLRQDQDPRLPAGFVGAAVVRADKPIAVAVVLESDSSSGDTVASYAAFAQEPQAAAPSPSPSAAPTPSPSPTARRTPPPSSPASIAVSLRAGWNQAIWLPAGCANATDALRSLLEGSVLRSGWRWAADTQSWLFFFPNTAAGFNTLTQVCSGQILWLNVTSETVWRQGP